MDISLPTSRSEAKKKKSALYYTGKPCVRGHLSPRYTSISNCVECMATRAERRSKEKADAYRGVAKKWRKENPERLKIYKKNRYQKVLEENSRWRRENRETVDLAIKLWKSRNVEAVREYARKWVRNNPEKCRANQAIRRVRKRNALPSWANVARIKLFYQLCPAGHEVDHIIPLAGEFVCGLHVENNLQYLPITENRKKGNRFNMASCMVGEV